MKSAWRNALPRGRNAVIGVPFAWLAVFFLLPFLVVLRISLSEMEGASFSDLLTFENGTPPFASTVRCGAVTEVRY